MQLVQWLRWILEEESLPYLDRWFAQRARASGMRVDAQKRIWDDLRRAFARAPGLAGVTEVASEAGWPPVRKALRGREVEWAAAVQKPNEITPLWCGIPTWLIPEFTERAALSSWTAAQTGHFLRAQLSPAPLHVRFSLGEAAVALSEDWAARRWISRTGTEPYVYTGPGDELSRAFLRGWVEIQDASSQQCLGDLDVRPGHRVWDVCCGNGGKTMILAQALGGRGVLTATDISAAKLKTLKDRVKRSGWQNVRILTWDGETLPAFGKEIEGKGGFDRVVVDAPCSAGGTWRRDPEARFRTTKTGLAELAAHQARLIRLGWRALKPGGSLAYVTCSWLPSENEHVVQSFAREADATIVSEKLWGLPLSDANTLYCAVLQKPGASA